jgi:hypothetical protein
MKIAKIIMAGTAALIITSSAALAQQALTGTVTKVDRINRTIAIQQTQSGTIGANTGGAAEEFKAQNGLSLDCMLAIRSPFPLRKRVGSRQSRNFRNSKSSESVI